MAVHSMKTCYDLPKGLKLSHSPAREDYRDVLIVREGIESLEDLLRELRLLLEAREECINIKT